MNKLKSTIFPALIIALAGCVPMTPKTALVQPPAEHPQEPPNTLFQPSVSRLVIPGAKKLGDTSIWIVDGAKSLAEPLLPPDPVSKGLSSLYTFGATTVTLAWNPSTSATVVGYNLYRGTAPGDYTKRFQDVPSPCTLNLVMGATNYFAATAFDRYGVESDFSNAIRVYANTNPPPRAIAAVLTTEGTTNLANFYNIGTNATVMLTNRPVYEMYRLLVVPIVQRPATPGVVTKDVALMTQGTTNLVDFYPGVTNSVIMLTNRPDAEAYRMKISLIYTNR